MNAPEKAADPAAITQQDTALALEQARGILPEFGSVRAKIRACAAIAKVTSPHTKTADWFVHGDLSTAQAAAAAVDAAEVLHRALQVLDAVLADRAHRMRMSLPDREEAP